MIVFHTINILIVIGWVYFSIKELLIAYLANRMTGKTPKLTLTTRLFLGFIAVIILILGLYIVVGMCISLYNLLIYYV